MTRRLAAGDRLVLASHNAGKLGEFEQLLAGSGVELVSAARLGLPEPEETAKTFAGNAALKAHAAATASGLPALADDSGFCVRALGGAPGLYSARWAGPGRDFGVAMQRVRDAVAASDQPADTHAWFISVLCLAWPDGAAHCVEGRIDGRFAWPPLGGNGHGYDPVFVPEGDTRRFAEMDDSEKNAISHRARSFALFAQACLPSPGGRQVSA